MCRSSNKTNKHCTDNEYVCLTKVGQAVKFVLGNSNEVSHFDKRRQRHKQWPKNKDYLEEYMAQLAIIETRLSSKLRQLQQQLGQWEKDFFVNNSKTANSNDIESSPPAKLLIDQIKYAKAISKRFKQL